MASLFRQGDQTRRGSRYLRTAASPWCIFERTVASLKISKSTKPIPSDARENSDSGTALMPDWIGAHVNAINFMRVVSETTAAVLVTLPQGRGRLMGEAYDAPVTTVTR